MRRALINVVEGVEFLDCHFFIWKKRPLMASYPIGKNTTLYAAIITGSKVYDVDTKQLSKVSINSVISTPSRVLVK